MEQLLAPARRLFPNNRTGSNGQIDLGRLGKMFKTNESQLSVVKESLSGDKGFTLVKGLPGPGKVSIFPYKFFLSLQIFLLMSVVSFTHILLFERRLQHWPTS